MNIRTRSRVFAGLFVSFFIVFLSACGQLEEGTVTDKVVVGEYVRQASAPVQTFSCGMRPDFEGKMKSDCWYGFHGATQSWEETVPECLKITYGNGEDSDSLCVTSREWERYAVGDNLVAKEVARGATAPVEIAGTRR